MIPVNRALAATIAYAAMVLAAPPIAGGGLEILTDALRSAWMSTTQAATAAVIAVIDAVSRVETVLAVFLPITGIGFAGLFGLIVWPATVEHVPNRQAVSRRSAEVIGLGTDRREPPVRMAA